MADSVGAFYTLAPDCVADVASSARHAPPARLLPRGVELHRLATSTAVVNVTFTLFAVDAAGASLPAADPPHTGTTATGGGA